MVWLGKDVDLGGGSLRTAGNEWEALLAHWLSLSVGVCSVRRLQQFLGLHRAHSLPTHAPFTPSHNEHIVDVNQHQHSHQANLLHQTFQYLLA